MKECRKDECTADVRTVFQCEKGSINPDTREKENGHWCMLCKYILKPDIFYVTIYIFI